MNHATARPTPIDMDALLQDSYLLVVNLRHKGDVQESNELWARCTEKVERVRTRLMEAGMNERSIDRISYAQCALLDETVLARATGNAHAEWAARPLQAHFFKRHEAGVQLYEDMREALAEPAPDRNVLTCYHRVLMLGFQGSYPGERSAVREQLVAALGERVEAFAPATDIAGLLRNEQRGALRWLRVPLVHVLVAASLVAGLWWGLNHLLFDAIGRLLLAGS